MAREALGVGDDDLVGHGTEHVTKRVDLGLGAPTAGGGVGLVRDEHGPGSDLGAVDTPPRLGGADQPRHDPTDVLAVQTGAVERAVGDLAGEHLGDRPYAALPGGPGLLHDERGRAHPEQHAVPTAVERQCRILDHLVGGSGPGRQEAGADPAEEGLAGDVVGGHDDHAVASAGPDPVLRDGDRLGRAGAGGVHLRVGPARTDVLGELRVPHRQHAEEELAVEPVGLGLELALELVQPPLDVLAHHGVRRGIEPRDELAEELDALVHGLVLVIGVELGDQRVGTGER